MLEYILYKLLLSVINYFSGGDPVAPAHNRGQGILSGHSQGPVPAHRGQSCSPRECPLPGWTHPATSAAPQGHPHLQSSRIPLLEAEPAVVGGLCNIPEAGITPGAALGQEQLD